MRKFTYLLLTIGVLVFTTEATAQLYVKTGSYIFNKASSVFVKGEINLNGTGNFYLRNEGQLLQATSGNSANTGAGNLSVFQEGTCNNYAYNYWCSPVGMATAATVGNEPFGITMFQVPISDVDPRISNPVGTTSTSYNGTSATAALTISSFWIHTYHNPSTSYSGWVQTGVNSTIIAGRGFSMKGVSGNDLTLAGEATFNNPSVGPNNDNQRYDFRGKPNDGNINIVVEGDKYTLTGNPYPSALDLNKFFDANATTLDGKAYFWEQDKTINSHNIAAYRGGYAIYNFASVTYPSSGHIYTPSTFTNYNLDGTPIIVPVPPVVDVPVAGGRFAAIGQGFMVKGKAAVAANSSATFTNNQRVFVKEGSTSVFQKNGNANTSLPPTDYGFYEDILNVAGTDYTQISKAPPPHIKINSTLNGSPIRQVAIGFRPGSVDGVDITDALSTDTQSNLAIDMYMVLNNQEYIHSVTTFDINKRFPIGFKNNGTGIASFKLQVFEFVNFDAADNVYLYDGLTGLYHDIKTTFYDLLLSPGVYNNRFEITFLNNQLGIDENISDSFVIVQNNSNQLLSISNPNILDVKSVALYDMVGKLIFDKVNLGANSNYEFSTSNLSDAVYIVKLQTADNKSIGQKVIVKKNN